MLSGPVASLLLMFGLRLALVGRFCALPLLPESAAALVGLGREGARYIAEELCEAQKYYRAKVTQLYR